MRTVLTCFPMIYFPYLLNRCFGVCALLRQELYTNQEVSLVDFGDERLSAAMNLDNDLSDVCYLSRMSSESINALGGRVVAGVVHEPKGVFGGYVVRYDLERDLSDVCYLLCTTSVLSIDRCSGWGWVAWWQELYTNQEASLVDFGDGRLSATTVYILICLMCAAYRACPLNRSMFWV